MSGNDESPLGMQYEELLREGILSCLSSVRARRDPAADWDGFAGLAADEILGLFVAADDETLPSHVEKAARRYLERSREEPER